MLHIPTWKRLLILGLIAIGLLYAMPNLFYSRVEQHNDAVTAAERAGRAESPRPALWKDARLLLLGPIVLGVALAAVVLWGLGASLGFPVGMSAAADDPRRAAANVSVVSTIGYGAFLGGPPLLGLLGEAVGVRGALGFVMIFVIVSMLLVSNLRPPASAGARAGTAA